MIKRPYWLIVLLLFLAVTQAGNVFRALASTGVTSLVLPFELIFGGVWTMILVGMAVIVWRIPGSRAVRRIPVLLMVFSFYVVARLVIFARADYDRQRLPFLMLFAAAIIVILVVQEIISKHGSE